MQKIDVKRKGKKCMKGYKRVLLKVILEDSEIAAKSHYLHEL